MASDALSAVVVILLLAVGAVLLIRMTDLKTPDVPAFESFGGLSEQLGLQLARIDHGFWNEKLPVMEGSYRGYPIAIRHEHRPRGKGYAVYTVVELQFPGADFDFSIEKENLVLSLGEALGVPRIKTGQDNFDAVYVISSSRPDLMPALFDHQLCDHLLKNEQQLNWPIEFKDDALLVIQADTTTRREDAEKLLAAIDRCIPIAERIASQIKNPVNSDL